MASFKHKTHRKDNALIFFSLLIPVVGTLLAATIFVATRYNDIAWKGKRKWFIPIMLGAILLTALPFIGEPLAKAFGGGAIGSWLGSHVFNILLKIPGVNSFLNGVGKGIMSGLRIIPNVAKAIAEAVSFSSLINMVVGVFTAVAMYFGGSKKQIDSKQKINDEDVFVQNDSKKQNTKIEFKQEKSSHQTNANDDDFFTDLKNATNLLGVAGFEISSNGNDTEMNRDGYDVGIDIDDQFVLIENTPKKLDDNESNELNNKADDTHTHAESFKKDSKSVQMSKVNGAFIHDRSKSQSSSNGNIPSQSANDDEIIDNYRKLSNSSTEYDL